MSRWYLPLKKMLIVAFSIWLVSAAGNRLMQRWLIVRAQDWLGAIVSIDRTRVSFVQSAIALDGVKLHHAQASAQPLLECERVFVDVEGTPLARRKLIVRDARAEGVRLFAGPGSQFAPVVSQAGPADSWLPASSDQEQIDRWFAAVAQTMQRAGSERAESLRLVDRLEKLIPRRLLELQDEMTILELRLEWLGELSGAPSVAELAPDNLPARIASTIPSRVSIEKHVAEESSAEIDLPESLRTLTLDWQTLREHVTEMRRLWDIDRHSILAVHAKDLKQSRPQLALPAIEPQRLAKFFLEQEAQRRASEVLKYVQWGHRFLPAAATDLPEAAQVGWAINYPERNPLPDFLVKAFHFEGEGEVGALPVRFAGTLQNLTHDSRRLGEATRVVIDAQSPHRVVIEAMLDRTSDERRDHIVIRLPAWPQPATTLGDARRVAFHVPPGVASLRAELAFAGDQLQGTIHLQRQRIALAPRVAESLGGVATGQILAELLAGVETLDAEVAISGPLKSPEVTFSAPSAAKLASSLQQALLQEMQQRETTLLARLEQGLTAQLVALDSNLEREQTKLFLRLDTGDAQMRALIARVEKPAAEPVSRHPLRRPASAQQRTKAHPLR